MEQTKQTTAAGLYEKLKSKREPFLRRARECSELTIPALLPRDGHSGNSHLPTPWQGVGARGLNNLASKLLLSLFPPNTPIFKLSIDDFTLEELTQQEGMRAKVEQGLNKVERAVQGEIEATAIRVSIFEGLKHLLVSGNTLVYMHPQGGAKIFHLNRYVVRRDTMGNVLDIIVQETVSPDALPENIREAIVQEQEKKKVNTEDDVELYTHVCRKGKQWEVYQEVKGIKIPGSEGKYPLDKSPWIAVRFTKIDGESYGRGYVEEYLGDLKSLEGLSQAIVEGAAAASKMLFLVNPNGVTEKEDLAEADNGSFIDGLDTDVTTLQVQKFNDFRVAESTSSKIEERLSFAFLLNSAVQRSGERVTAEEIRYMANELEAALGGIYSILSQELQLPLINRVMYQMEGQKRLPMLPKGVVKPVIVTGIEALGRGNDLNKLDQFIAPAQQNPEIAGTVNWSDYMTRRGTALGIDMQGLIKSQEQVAQEQQQAQQRAMMQQALGPGITAGSQLLQKGLENAQGQASAE